MGDPRKIGSLQQIRMAAEENRQTVNAKTGNIHAYFAKDSRGPAHPSGIFFTFRFFLAILLFAGFCFMEREQRHIGDYDSSAICQIIQEDMDFSKVFKGRL